MEREREDLSRILEKSQSNWIARAHTNEVPTAQAIGNDNIGSWQPWLERALELLWKDCDRSWPAICLGTASQGRCDPQRIEKGDDPIYLCEEPFTLGLVIFC